MKLIIITGMPGSGKSEVAQAFQNAGFPIIVMGDIVREETRRRGLEANPENTRKVMLELRKIDGPGAIARHCLDIFHNIKSEMVVIEGCRSLAEIDVFDDFADEIYIVCVHASPKIRYERLCTRNREDAPLSWESFRERDIREISVGLGGVIALSDIMLINEGTLEDFQLFLKKLVSKMT